MPISKIKGNAIEDDAITSARLDDGTIVAVDLASDSVTTAKIQDGAVTAVKLDAAAVTPAAVSDTDNTSTGQFTLPAGTTAQRPVTSYTGAQRYNTTLSVMEYYDGTQWKKISAEIANLNSVSGTLYVGIAGSGLTLTGSGFLSANLVVNFTQSSDGIDEDVTVTPSSDTSATVTVPAAVYNNVTAGNAVTIKVTNSDLSQSSGVNTTAVDLPSGGTITTDGDYRVHTFTSTSNFVIPTGFSTTYDYLIVAGGGGGGGNQGGGGGGAGGMVTASAQSLSTGTYTATVGAGGAGSTSAPGAGANGNNSVFNSTTVIGGGGGAVMQTSSPYGRSGNNGGSGGGASFWVNAGSFSGGAGTSGQGNNGGSATQGGPSGHNGGGGGGKSSAGSAANSDSGGDGGAGAEWPTSSGNYYAGGGGGGCYYTGNTAGNGGIGGGGAGDRQEGVDPDGDGTQGSPGSGFVQDGYVNTGGGGGGGGSSVGDGASGIIIVRYDLTAL